METRRLTKDGEIHLPSANYNPDDYALMRVMPGAHYSGISRCWKVSIAPEDRMRVLELAKQLNLEIDPSLENVPHTPQALEALKKGLYPFQIEGVQWLSSQSKGGILGDEMGLGKTVQSLLALDKKDATIVICPSSLKYNWVAECKKWRPDLKAYVCQGKHMFGLPFNGEVLVINYEMLPDWLYTESTLPGHPKPPVKIPDGLENRLKNLVVILDEAHGLSNNDTKKHDKIFALTRLVRKVFALTGTCLLNRPNQLLGVLSATNLVHRSFESLASFHDNFRARAENRGSYVRFQYGTPSPESPGLLRRVMLRRTRQQVIPELPKKTYQVLGIGQASAALSGKMDDIWLRFLREVDDLEGGLPPFEEMSRVRAEMARSRVPAALEYCDMCEENGIPLVVASAHRSPLDAISERKGWKSITGETPPRKRQQIVNEFQAGKLKGLGISIRAAGLGITLTYGWLMLMVDLEWTPALNRQCEDRLLRIGQNQPVQIVQMVGDHPLERHLHRLLGCKEELIRCSVELDTAHRLREMRENS
jgi:SNF2 family DNA or RNA helicase